MIALLDTHILLWWLADDPALSDRARSLIQDDTHTVFVSSASAWEIAIKKAAGKLKAPDDLESALEANGFETLAITVRHALAAGALRQFHVDPFDRILVAQAELEQMTLITDDQRLISYGNFVQMV
jgi:PIN domain nuclease of toxin-antitoxin system